jgi:hypothetical protein
VEQRQVLVADLDEVAAGDERVEPAGVGRQVGDDARPDVGVEADGAVPGLAVDERRERRPGGSVSRVIAPSERWTASASSRSGSSSSRRPAALVPSR